MRRWQPLRCLLACFSIAGWDNVSPDNLLEFAGVAYDYPDGSAGLAECTLAVQRGAREVLIGANGAGKTTFFQLANGLLRPQRGSVRYAGAALDYSRAGLRELRGKVGLVFQNPDRQLFSASVYEDVSFGPLNLGLDEPTVRERVDAALDAVGMTMFSEKSVHNLSFGQKKRVCIAGVLAMQPEMLLLDEPLAGLDPAMREEFLMVLDRLNAAGVTLLLATHDVDFAYRWADRAHLLAGGRCLATLASEQLPSAAAALAAVGMPLPHVARLAAALAARGLLPGDASPRTPAELLSLLADVPAVPFSKERLMTSSSHTEAVDAG